MTLFPVVVNCPEDVWPGSFSGNVAIAITAVSGPNTPTLWLVFEIDAGRVSHSSAVLSRDTQMPEPVRATNPIIHAEGQRDTWNLLIVDRESFYEKVGAGELQIGGDYRTFGRYSPALLRLVEATDLWEHLNEIVARVSELQAAT